MIVTSPLVTVKSVPSNVATPALVSVASSADICKVLLVILVLIPAPALTVRVSPRAIAWAVPVSAPIVIVEFASLALVTLASVLTVGVPELPPPVRPLPAVRVRPLRASSSSLRFTNTPAIVVAP